MAQVILFPGYGLIDHLLIENGYDSRKSDVDLRRQLAELVGLFLNAGSEFPSHYLGYAIELIDLGWQPDAMIYALAPDIEWPDSYETSYVP